MIFPAGFIFSSYSYTVLKERKGAVRVRQKGSIPLIFCMAAGLTAGICTMLFLTGREEFVSGHQIAVVARESGSGTRSSFHELFDLWERDNTGRRDLMTTEAMIVNRNGTMMAFVAGNPYAIGYGSLNERMNGVKPLSIDGVTPTLKNIRNGTYPYARFFFLAVREEAGAEFLRYALSEAGQSIVEEAGYLPVERVERPEREAARRAGESGGAGKASGRSGTEEERRTKRVLAGSSSVIPLAASLADGYRKENPLWKGELQECDSGTGMRLLLSGAADVALLSRELTEEEKNQVLWAAVAADGIAVYVNEKNPVDALSAEEIREIYLGRKQVWN